MFGKSTFSLKIILLSTLPVFFFSVLSMALLLYKIEDLDDSVAEITGDTLHGIYSQMLENKSLDIAEKVSLKIGTVLDELNILRGAAQGLIDNDEGRFPGARLQSDAWARNDFIHNAERNWSILRKSEADVSISVWGYLHDADGAINRETMEYVTLMTPLKTLMNPVGRYGVEKGWYYVVGPKATPVMVMTPWARMPEIFDRQYPGHNTENWWDFFFPGVVEAWNQWPGKRDLVSDNPRSQITLTPLYEDAGGTGLMVTFFSPLWNKSRTGNFGAAAVDYNIRHITDIVSKEKIGENGFTFLMRVDGSVLGATDAMAEKLGLSRSVLAGSGVEISHFNLKESGIGELARIAAAFDKGSRFALYEFQDNDKNGFLMSIQKILEFNLWSGKGPEINRESLHIVAVVPKGEVFQAQYRVQASIGELSRRSLTSLVGISVFFAIVSISFAGWYAVKNTRQIRRMSQGISAVREKNYDMSVDIIARDDLGELARSFNHMTEEIRRAYNQLENHARELEQKVKERTLHLEEANKQLELLSMVDGLTKISNRRYFDLRFDEIWREYARLRHPISIILIDIDHFKKYNDLYGHLAGDNCLCLVASTLKSQARRGGDVIARYGGEEFIIIACGDIESACQLAEKIRLAVEALSMEHASSEKGIVSISLGVASVVPTHRSGMAALIAAADKALYRSKEGGRDRVSSGGTIREPESVQGDVRSP